ncbi:MAG: methyltransferase domain-containing protein [Acidimicrobiales bacterium]
MAWTCSSWATASSGSPASARRPSWRRRGSTRRGPGALSPAARAALRCPRCGGALDDTETELRCGAPSCQTGYARIEGVPVLLDDEHSIFDETTIKTYLSNFSAPPSARWRERTGRFLPSISRNIASERNLRRLADLLRLRTEPLVLVLGGRAPSLGMDTILGHPDFDCIQSDVIPGPEVNLICDAHSLPFGDASVDCVVAQAVLEHVLDPALCAAQIARVLKPGGLLYAETPFMQQVHAGALDFTRFTHLGHRRLFRAIDEIDSGIVCGPGMSLAWAWAYFLTSFARTGASRRALLTAARLTAFWWPWFDSYLADKPGAFDAASAFYFLGEKRGPTVPDREIPPLYRGAQQ